jgi:hypothetical protein
MICFFRQNIDNGNVINAKKLSLLFSENDWSAGQLNRRHSALLSIFAVVHSCMSSTVRRLSINVEILPLYRLSIVEPSLLPPQSAWLFDSMSANVEPASNENTSCPSLPASQSLLFMTILPTSTLASDCRMDHAQACGSKSRQFQFLRSSGSRRIGHVFTSSRLHTLTEFQRPQ